MRDVISIHYGEVALKGSIRGWFEERLAKNIAVALTDVGPCRVRRIYGRLVLELPAEPAAVAPIVERLKDVFGIAWFGRGLRTAAAWPAIEDATRRLLAPLDARTFGVRAKKADATWPLGRTEMCVKLGAWIEKERGWKVDLGTPDVWVILEIVNGEAIVTAGRVQGLKGLPVGVSGRVLALLSGGIDSPVAAFRMMSRGCRVEMLHFHSAPHTSAASQEKVLELARTLSRYQTSIHLGMVPFAPCQQEIVRETPPRYRVLLYRRMMMRIAERVARRVEAQALVTGESLGQVASQTLANLVSVESIVGMPVLRPLVGTDKEETIALARRAGTFEVSIQPHDDCCSFLLPKRPATASTAVELDEAEKSLDVDRLVREAVERLEPWRIVAGSVRRASEDATL